jgi:hypothetical protein
MAYHHPMNETPPLPAPSGWLEALERAEADLAAGRVYDGAAVRQRLRDSIKRMQAEAKTKATQSS